MKHAWLLLPLISVSAPGGERLSVAGAANLIHALEALHAEFRKIEPATAVTVVTGASGSLVAQIQNGAPYDVFLSADREYPEKLVAWRLAEAATLTPFAVGRLVLWTRRADVEVESVPAVIRNPAVRKIAVANLTSAPYGRAAREALTQLGLWPEAAPKIVVGENITQTAQFVETGNADAGFVALSLVLSPQLKDKGRWHEIDPALHAPLEHAAVVTKRGSSNPAAGRYLRFLQGAEARAVFLRFGYRPPPEKSP